MLSTAELSRFDLTKLRETPTGDDSPFGAFTEDECHTLCGWVKDAQQKIHVKKSVARIRSWATQIIDEIDANTDRPVHVVQQPRDSDQSAKQGTSTENLPPGLGVPITRIGAKSTKSKLSKPKVKTPEMPPKEQKGSDCE